MMNKEEEREEIKKIQKGIEEACKTTWDELAAIPQKYGYNKSVSNLLVALVLQNVFYE